MSIKRVNKCLNNKIVIEEIIIIMQIGKEAKAGEIHFLHKHLIIKNIINNSQLGQMYKIIITRKIQSDNLNH